MQKPIIFNSINAKDTRALKALLNDTSVIKVDELLKQKTELLYVKNPKLLHALKPPKITVSSHEGRWVYFPWKKTLVRILAEKEYQSVRTSRNHNLITVAEQKKFSDAIIGIAGLNVGNPVALCLALASGARNLIKLADNDYLSLSNFNRFRAGLADLGKNKAILTAEQIWETDPYAKLEIFSNGIQPDIIEQFFQKPKINILVEETDNLQLKIIMREYAKKYRIPVLMVTGNGAGLIVDIERYDLEPKLPILNGNLKLSIIAKIKSKTNLVIKEKIALSRDFMGIKNLTPRLVSSFSLIGSKLAGIPQIAEASYLRGATVCNLIRRIVTGKKVHSGRYFVSLDDISK